MHKLLFSLVALGLTSTASAGFVDPFLTGTGYWDQHTARLWFSLLDYNFPYQNSWDTYASLFDPATGEAYGCISRDGCDIWASSTDVENVFDEIDHLPLGSSVSGPEMGAIFTAFGTTFGVGSGCDPSTDIGFEYDIAAGLTRDQDIVVTDIQTTQCGRVTPGTLGSAFVGPVDPSVGDMTFSAYVYEQFAIPESDTLALLGCGLVVLLAVKRRHFI